MKKKLKFFLVFSFLLFSVHASALVARLTSHEVIVVLYPQGDAKLYHTIEWNVSQGTMGAFYFEGEAFKPQWSEKECFLDANNKRYPLDITFLGGNNKYDIVLANGQRYSGKGHYFLTYMGNFAQSGLVGFTNSPEHGDLVYFSWSPVQWDSSLTYRAVRLVLPVIVSQEKISEEDKALLEKPCLPNPM